MNPPIEVFSFNSCNCRQGQWRLTNFRGLISACPCLPIAHVFISLLKLFEIRVWWTVKKNAEKCAPFSSVYFNNSLGNIFSHYPANKDTFLTQNKKSASKYYNSYSTDTTEEQTGEKTNFFPGPTLHWYIFHSFSPPKSDSVCLCVISLLRERFPELSLVT